MLVNTRRLNWGGRGCGGGGGEAVMPDLGFEPTT